MIHTFTQFYFRNTIKNNALGALFFMHSNSNRAAQQGGTPPAQHTHRALGCATGEPMPARPRAHSPNPHHNPKRELVPPCNPPFGWHL